MRCRNASIRSVPFIALLSLFTAGSSARGDLVLGFPNGLVGWNLPDNGFTTPGDPGTVTASGGTATIAESVFASETDLTMAFTVPTGARTLRFTLVSVSPDSTLAGNAANGYFPDAFGASLLDPNTGLPLVATVGGSDSFYTRDVVDGVTQGLAATGAGVSPLSGMPALVSLDLSSLLAGQQAEILFRLIGGTDPLSSSTVTLSDVDVITASGVPEPSTLLLGGLGSSPGSVTSGAVRGREQRHYLTIRPPGPIFASSPRAGSWPPGRTSASASARKRRRSSSLGLLSVIHRTASSNQRRASSRSPSCQWQRARKKALKPNSRPCPNSSDFFSAATAARGNRGAVVGHAERVPDVGGLRLDLGRLAGEGDRLRRVVRRRVLGGDQEPRQVVVEQGPLGVEGHRPSVGRIGLAGTPRGRESGTQEVAGDGEPPTVHHLSGAGPSDRWAARLV